MRFKSIQARLIEAKEAHVLADTFHGEHVLADTFPREKESGENLPTLALSSPQERNTPDPLIQGLINRLPEPDSTWSFNDRIKWLRTAANVFGLIYKCGEGEDREVKLVLAKDAYVMATQE